MKTPHLFLAALLVAIVSMTGCSDRNSSSQKKAENTPATASAPRTDEWLGKWTGPEGTFLELAGGHGKYDVTVQNLDGPRKFEGRYADGGIIRPRRDQGGHSRHRWRRDRHEMARRQEELFDGSHGRRLLQGLSTWKHDQREC